MWKLRGKNFVDFYFIKHSRLRISRFITQMTTYWHLIYLYTLLNMLFKLT